MTSLLNLACASTGTDAWGEPCCFCEYQEGEGILAPCWFCCKHAYCWGDVGNKHGRREWVLPLKVERKGFRFGGVLEGDMRITPNLSSDSLLIDISNNEGISFAPPTPQQSRGDEDGG